MTPPKCEFPLIYAKPDLCGIIRDPVSSPWAKCIKNIAQEVTKAIYDGCVFDMCGLEGNSELQSENFCNILEEFTNGCHELAEELGVVWEFDWRDKTNCGI
jgi:hypothetical protein